jgi:uncharacterized protein YhaN
VKILELYLKGFGAFTDRRLTFGEGLNIIYGANEAGKSTVHKFIEAMFYGFVKPGSKVRRMTDDYDRYRPWVGDAYEGYMIYRVNERDYRVERNLAKGRERVTIFDNTTGEDITGTFRYDKGTREYLFFHQHTGLNEAIYKNTISIRQLGSASDSALAKEIGTRISNLGTSGDIEISVSKAQRTIREYMDSIGTDRAYTKEAGRLCRLRDELEDQLARSRRKAESIRQMQYQLSQMLEQRDLLDTDADILRAEIKQAEDYFKYRLWREVKGLMQQIDDLESKLEHEMQSPSFNNLGIAAAKVHDGDIKISRNRELMDRIGQLGSMLDHAEELHSRIMDLERSITDTQQHRLQSEESRLANARRNWGLALGLCALTGVVSMAFAFAGRQSLYGIAVVAAIVGVGAVLRIAAIARDLSGVQAEMAADKERHKKEESKLQAYKDEMAGILIEYGVKDISGLRTKVMEARAMAERLEGCRRLLESKLGGIDPAELERTASGICADKEYSSGQLDEYKRKLGSILNEKNAVSAAAEKIVGSIEALQNDMKPVAEIEEELGIVKDRLKDIEIERSAAAIAIDVINQAAGQIHREFAPLLNRKVREVVQRVTGGRYSELRITPEMEILVSAPETGRQVAVGSLSGGTVDQFYFALRLGISDLISADVRLPMILDDSFVQYDIVRLENVIGYLCDISAERQVLLFTCQNREKEVADKLGGLYNYLEL